MVISFIPDQDKNDCFANPLGTDFGEWFAYAGRLDRNGREQEARRAHEITYARNRPPHRLQRLTYLKGRDSHNIFWGKCHMRIEIASGMACGKTTICRALASRGYHAVLENLEVQNPYLDDFYKDMERFSFPFQLSFVSSKYADIQRTDPAKINIHDYAVVNGRAYSALQFAEKPDMLAVIMSGYDCLERDLGPADIILHIECPVEIQAARIAARSRSTEDTVPTAYLEKFNQTLREYIQKEKDKGRCVLPVQDNSIAGIAFDDYINYIDRSVRQKIQPEPGLANHFKPGLS